MFMSSEEKSLCIKLIKLIFFFFFGSVQETLGILKTQQNMREWEKIDIDQRLRNHACLLMAVVQGHSS